MYGVDGVGGIFPPLMRASYGLFTGAIAILARAIFIEMDLRRLCAAGFLMIGEEELVVEFSYGSELKKDKAGD